MNSSFFPYSRKGGLLHEKIIDYRIAAVPDERVPDVYKRQYIYWMSLIALTVQ